MEPDISPLAKRLAEENNVRWNALPGSGANGRIVERDVLEYLARVMAGEEDINPTAEPVPEGMEAWPEEDVAAYYSDSSPAASAEASPISAATVVSEPPAEPPLQPRVELSDEPMLDMDDVGSSESGNEAFTAQADSLELAAEDVDTSDISEDIFLFDDDEDDLAQDEAEFSTTFGEATLDDTSAPEIEAAAFAPPAMDDVSYERLSETDEPVFAEEKYETPEPSETLSFDLDAAASEDSSDEVAALEASVQAVQHEEPVVVESLFNTESSEVEDEDISLFAEEAEPAEEKSKEEPEVPAADFDAGDFDDFDAGEAGEAEAEPLAASGEALSDVDEDKETTEESVEPVAMMDDIAESVPDTFEDDLEVTTTTPVPSEWPLVSYGVLLRRHADLTGMVQAQVTLGQVLDQDGPLPPSALLLRAAAKALEVAPLSGQALGLALFGESEVQVAAMSNVASHAFKEVVQQVTDASASVENQNLGLIVADMSDLGIDEVVLNLDAPVLALGRIMYDSNEGSHHSTLTLSGKLSVEQGSKFLAEVANLLDAPISLVI